MVKLCLFDLDGTLLDTLGNIAGHVNDTLIAFGIAPFPVSDFRYFVGNGAARLTELVLRARNAYTPELWERFYPRFKAAYLAAPFAQVDVYEGIPALLSELKARGIASAVCTNKPHEAAVSSVEHLFGKDAFFAVSGSRDTLPLKPSPDGAWEIMAAYGATKEETLFIGDSDVDMQTATAAGVRGFGATWGFRTEKELLAAGAYALLTHPTDLLSYL